MKHKFKPPLYWYAPKEMCNSDYVCIYHISYICQINNQCIFHTLIFPVVLAIVKFPPTRIFPPSFCDVILI